MCCMQVSWRGQASGMLGIEGKRYSLWLSGKGGSVGGVGVMENEEVVVGRVSDGSCVSF